jgi:hypothetical protein
MSPRGDDCLFLLAVDELPLPLLILSIIFAHSGSFLSLATRYLNAGLVVIKTRSNAGNPLQLYRYGIFVFGDRP